MIETNDYTPQLKKSIEWAKQTRWCVECQTMTPHRWFKVPVVLPPGSFFMYGYRRTEIVCGFCGHIEEVK